MGSVGLTHYIQSAGRVVESPLSEDKHLRKSDQRRVTRRNYCTKLNHCYKVKMVLDKDLSSFQYAEVIAQVCARCKATEEVGD